MREATLLVQRCIRRLQEEEAAAGGSSSPPSLAAGPTVSNRRVGHAPSRSEAVLELKLDSSSSSSSSSVVVWSGAQSAFHAPIAAQLEEDVFAALKARIHE